MNDAESLNELGGRGGFIYVALGAGGDGLEDAFVIHAGPRHDDAQVGPDGLKASHDVIEILAVTVAEQDQVDAVELSEIGKRGRHQFQIRFRIKEGPESNKP